MPATVPGRSPSIVIGGRYDTKRMATPFVGANDGGSSAAFLIELAQDLAHRRNKLTYWVVFFDGEEAVKRPALSYSGNAHELNREHFN
ncbi:MAG TPA: M28 family peptidase [Nitrospira sp.]|nr:M28 family peptidase [Nitrospira sp.]